MIISTTITNSRCDVIAEALKSIAPEVDGCIIIDTGAIDSTIDIAKVILGDKYVGAEFTWQNDFAAARNHALQLAKGHMQAVGGSLSTRDWIVTADTDEWLRVPGLKDFLDSVPTGIDVVMVPHKSMTYRQCRCIRATSNVQWHMPVHEYLMGYKSIEAPEGWHFECQPRPTEDKREKYERYAKVLDKLVADDPVNSRGWYYLADTLNILGYQGRAITSFQQCGKLPGWDEQAAWGYYRAAVIQFELGLRDKAFETAVNGCLRSDVCAELPWLAGWIAYQRGDFKTAETFALRALEIGPRVRRGFQYPPGQKELPEQLLVWARKQLSAVRAFEIREPGSPEAGD